MVFYVSNDIKNVIDTKDTAAEFSCLLLPENLA
jgi:hypothetical protein